LIVQSDHLISSRPSRRGVIIRGIHSGTLRIDTAKQDHHIRSYNDEDKVRYSFRILPQMFTIMKNPTICRFLRIQIFHRCYFTVTAHRICGDLCITGVIECFHLLFAKTRIRNCSISHSVQQHQTK
jgi:hypothetical protein